MKIRIRDNKDFINNLFFILSIIIASLLLIFVEKGDSIIKIVFLTLLYLYFFFQELKWDVDSLEIENNKVIFELHNFFGINRKIKTFLIDEISYEEKIKTLGRYKTKVKSIIIKTKSNESFELFGLTEKKYDDLILFIENVKNKGLTNESPVII